MLWPCPWVIYMYYYYSSQTSLLVYISGLRWAFTGPLVLWLFGSSLFLEVTKTSIISRMSSNFNQIRPLTAELSVPECLKINSFCCGHSSIFVFQWFFFVLAGNKDNYNISYEFEFLPDPTSDCGVSCPLVFEKSIFCIVATLAPSILIGSSSFLGETRITKKKKKLSSDCTCWLSGERSLPLGYCHPFDMICLKLWGKPISLQLLTWFPTSRLQSLKVFRTKRHYFWMKTYHFLYLLLRFSASMIENMFSSRKNDLRVDKLAKIVVRKLEIMFMVNSFNQNLSSMPHGWKRNQTSWGIKQSVCAVWMAHTSICP